MSQQAQSLDDLARLSLTSGHEELVEVNQRALIDKVLARYSGEYTVFRELLQNADDATASNVEVHFATTAALGSQPPLLSNIKSEKISKIIVKNDGIVFREEDWRRLKTIADGQPNEERIGAFGVGFYSIWSHSDDPLVISGDSMMYFFWKGNQLAVKRATNPQTAEMAPSGRPWTLVSMPCREPEPMPKPADFCKFLATSLAFTAHIKTMTVYFGGHQLCRLEKKAAPSTALKAHPRCDLRSAGQTMQLAAIESTPLQIDCKMMKALNADNLGEGQRNDETRRIASELRQNFATRFLNFASSSSRSQEPASRTPVMSEHDLAESVSTSVFLRIVTAQSRFSAPAAFVAEIERSTKKKPPTSSKVQLLYTTQDELEAGPGSADAPTNGIENLFRGLVVEPGSQGRIFIGFGTHQSTGCAASIASHLIPTVERENLDLQTRHIADYNRELLSVAGIVARCVYDHEMQQVARLWINGPGESEADASSSIGDPGNAKLLQRASHLMRFFTFHISTPIASVGSTIQQSFFSCNVAEYLIASTKGILPTSQVRIPAPELAFLSGLSVVPDSIAQANTLLLEQLQERGMIKSIDVEDMVVQLNKKPLNVAEGSALLKWWISLSWNPSYDPRILAKLRIAAVIAVPQESQAETIVTLASVKYILSAKTIPPDMPVPTSVLPYAVSKGIPAADLLRVFGWSELPLPDWIKHLASQDVLSDPQHSVILSPSFSEKMLNVLAKSWGNIPPAQSTIIVTLLQNLACIPTKMGMKAPREAYFPKVDLFDDLPVTTLTVRGSLEKVLAALGVRKNADLALIFSRLLGGGQWQEDQVARYLVSVANTLTADEKDKLSKTAWLRREGEAPLTEGTDGKPARPVRHKAQNLYEPSDALRELGLPILSWQNQRWRSTSEEAKLLFSMGLKRHPSIDEILEIAADRKHEERQKRALAYFMNNFESFYNQSYQPSKVTQAFVPVLHNGTRTYAKPSEAYSSAGAAVMGFPILHPDYQLNAAKFKLTPDPKASELVARLLSNPPHSAATAIPIFAYLAGQASRFSAADFSSLAASKFIPVHKQGGGPIELYNPKSVFFAGQEGSIASQYSSLFTFVDFGTSANAFLLQCGVRAEPNAAELTQLVLADPRRFLALAASSEKYISLLRQLAAHYNSFSNQLKKKMRDTPFLLGFERVSTTKGTARAKPSSTDANGEDDDGDADDLLQYRLALASDIVIIDDTTTLNDFREYILACPQDDLVEAFVEQLGGRRISRLVTTNYSSSPVPEKASARAESLRKLILERLALLLHERQQTSNDVRHKEDWLKEHLVVKEVERLERQRILNLSHSSRFMRTSPASAAATSERGTLLLRISANLNDLDYYEVAASLTGIILSKQKIHDTLLFMTLLQTSLRDLRRRGFNVDRIMNARRAEQEAMEMKRREERARIDAARIVEQQQQEKSRDKALPPSYEGGQGNVQDNKSNGFHPGSPQPKAATPLPASATSLFNSFRQKLRQHPMTNTSIQGGPSSPRITEVGSQEDGVGGSSNGLAPAAPRAPVKSLVSGPDYQVTPRSNITTNVLRAIAASKPDRSGNITSQVNTTEVKESTSSYCDDTPANDLDYASDIAGVRFYISRKVEPDENILHKHAAALHTYITQVVKPVGSVFNVDPRALHVFYDTSGPLIAFNRSGSIFFNLRYHLEWHGHQVANGKFDDALISTYFSMAHELAHNLVLQHDSTHSFYTSSIAQTFFSDMAAYIASVSVPRQTESK